MRLTKIYPMLIKKCEIVVFCFREVGNLGIFPLTASIDLLRNWPNFRQTLVYERVNFSNSGDTSSSQCPSLHGSKASNKSKKKVENVNPKNRVKKNVSLLRFHSASLSLWELFPN